MQWLICLLLPWVLQQHNDTAHWHLSCSYSGVAGTVSFISAQIIHVTSHVAAKYFRCIPVPVSVFHRLVNSKNHQFSKLLSFLSFCVCVLQRTTSINFLHLHAVLIFFNIIWHIKLQKFPYVKTYMLTGPHGYIIYCISW